MVYKINIFLNIILYIILLSFLIIGCTSIQEDKEKIEVKKNERTIILNPDNNISMIKPTSTINFTTEDFCEKPFKNSSVYVPVENTDNLDDVKAKLENIISIKESDVKNRFDENIIDRIISISTMDYQIYYYYASIKDFYYRESFEIYNTKHELKYNLRIGMSCEELLKVIGNDEIIYKDHSVIICTGTEVAQLYITIKNDKVLALRITNGL